MKILGIMGSPRKNGNTHILIDEILKGAKSAGAETEIILLSEHTIRECNGCLHCWKGLECTKQDGMNALYNLIEESDVLVFGTPVYWYGPTAIMKAFLDRFLYFNCAENRPKIKGKKAAIAVPFEEKDPETAAITVAMLEKSFAWLELEQAGTIIVPGVNKRGDIHKKEQKLKKAYELGRKLASQ